MNEDNLKVKRIEFQRSKFYEPSNQWIIGCTINKEIETYNCNVDSNGNITGGDDYKKYEFNLWLGLIGLHMIIRKRT